MTGKELEKQQLRHDRGIPLPKNERSERTQDTNKFLFLKPQTDKPWQKGNEHFSQELPFTYALLKSTLKCLEARSKLIKTLTKNFLSMINN